MKISIVSLIFGALCWLPGLSLAAPTVNPTHKLPPLPNNTTSKKTTTNSNSKVLTEYLGHERKLAAVSNDIVEMGVRLRRLQEQILSLSAPSKRLTLPSMTGGSTLKPSAKK